tara:strand:+ start:4149 stop:4565 length:417 start_codon:yes stop_codon:yes gene_type:complete
LLLRINIWISFNGLQKGAFSGVSFPYVALCPSTRKKSLFVGITDVYEEIIRLSNEAEQKGFNVGEAIYTQSFFFADHKLLLASNMQNRIKEFKFCKTFSCPPYPNLQETPANIIDDFFIIEEELNHCMNKQQKDKQNA